MKPFTHGVTPEATDADLDGLLIMARAADGSPIFVPAAPIIARAVADALGAGGTPVTPSTGIGREEIIAGVTAASDLDGKPPAPTPFSGGATWSAVGMRRLAGGGMEPTLTTTCHASIDSGDPVGRYHTWQIRGPGDSTQIEIAWCLAGDPTNGTGYVVRLSRASNSVSWNVSMRKIGASSALSPTVKRINPATQRHTGSTSLSAVIPDAETRIQVRVGADAAKVFAVVEWGTDESIYMEIADTAYRGIRTGVTSLTPSGAKPLFQARMGLPNFSRYRPRRQSSPSILTLTPTGDLQDVSGDLVFTGAGKAHVISVTGDVIVQQAPGTVLTKPVYIYASGGSIRCRGMKLTMEVQPGNDAAGGLEMGDGSPAIRPRLVASNAMLRLSSYYGFTIEGVDGDVAGHSADAVITPNENGTPAEHSANYDARFLMTRLRGWRNDNASAGNGAHGDSYQPQATVIRNMVVDKAVFEHWGSVMVLEWLGTFGAGGYLDGAQNVVFGDFDNYKDTRYTSGHLMYHASDEEFTSFCACATPNLQITGTLYWNWPAGSSGFPGNYIQNETREYDAAGSDPANGYYKFGSTGGISYIGLDGGEGVDIPQMEAGSTRPTPIVDPAQIGTGYLSPYFDDM